MYKVGLIGLKTSIDQILGMVEEYKHELEFTSYSYDQIEEIEEIVNEYTPHVHAWLFSGPLPYEIAKNI